MSTNRSSAENKRRTPTASTSSKSSSSGGRGRTNSLPTHVVDYLKAWILSPEHINHPYPTEQEKARIQQDTGIELKKLNNWFVNNRIRFWKPRFEAMQRKQREQEQSSSTTASTTAPASASKSTSSSVPTPPKTARKRTGPGRQNSHKNDPVSPETVSSVSTLLPRSDGDGDGATTDTSDRQRDQPSQASLHADATKDSTAARLDKVYTVLSLALGDTSESAPVLSCQPTIPAAPVTTHPAISVSDRYSCPVSDTSASTSVASSHHDVDNGSDSEASVDDTEQSPVGRVKTIAISAQSRRRVSLSSVSDYSGRKRAMAEHGDVQTPRSKYSRKDEDLWRNACMSSSYGNDDTSLPTLDEAAVLFGLAQST